MKLQPTTTASPPSLHTLGTVELNPFNHARLDEALARNGGDAPWRARKAKEARELLALGQIAPARVDILELDLRRHLRVVLSMRVPVPCRAAGEDDLTVAPVALLGLDYSPDAMRQSLPGSSFITLLEPRHVFHANCSTTHQALCLGAEIPAGIRVKWLLLSTYTALAMQSLQIDPFDPAGVLNSEAAFWWQQNLHRVPLTREPFLPADCAQ